MNYGNKNKIEISKIGCSFLKSKKNIYAKSSRGD